MVAPTEPGDEALVAHYAFNADPRTLASFFVGDVDDVRIYERALPAAEVAGMAGRTQAFDEP